jgi:hypothetical protein
MNTKLLKTIKLNKSSGELTLAEASDVFSYIDSDFKNWNLNKKDKATKEMTLEVREMTEDATFAQLFENPEQLILTQEQIIDFCKNHKEDLREYGDFAFFLFKVDDKFFVASVLVSVGGRLYVRVDPLEYVGVWGAESRRRLVAPQLETLSPSTDSLKLGNFDPSEIIQRLDRIETLLLKHFKNE